MVQLSRHAGDHLEPRPIAVLNLENTFSDSTLMEFLSKKQSRNTGDN